MGIKGGGDISGPEFLSNSGGTLRERGLMTGWPTGKIHVGGWDCEESPGIEGQTKSGWGDDAQIPLNMLSSSSSVMLSEEAFSVCEGPGRFGSGSFAVTCFKMSFNAFSILLILFSSPSL